MLCKNILLFISKASMEIVFACIYLEIRNINNYESDSHKVELLCTAFSLPNDFKSGCPSHNHFFFEDKVHPNFSCVFSDKLRWSVYLFSRVFLCLCLCVCGLSERGRLVNRQTRARSRGTTTVFPQIHKLIQSHSPRIVRPP